MAHEDTHHSLSRRGFLVGSSALAGSALAAPAFAKDSSDKKAKEQDITGDGPNSDMPLKSTEVEFEGEHQAGISTPPQAFANVLGFNLYRDVKRDDAKRLLRLWTEDARRLTTGKTPVGDLEPELAWTPANLTMTCGLGEPFFDKLGLTDQKPSWLHDIDAFSKDKLEDEWGQTDICVQICADDPITLAHATRHFIRSSVRYAEVKWLQHGFLHASGSVEKGATGRNLFGFKDGTVNPSSDEEYADQVWIDEGPDWAKDGTCLVVRRIAYNMDEWEKLDRASREMVFGRTMTEGAPLSGGDEFTPADYKKTDELGLPVIDPMSHMARAVNPDDKPNQKLKRRAYNYDLPPVPGDIDRSNSGLIFICFQKNPEEQFTAIQKRLDQADRLNQWTTHIGSSVYFCPPGVGEGRDTYWAEGLLES